MNAKEFYDKRLSEDPTIGSVQLMEDFAKHIIEKNFCDGSPTDFADMHIWQLKNSHDAISMLVDWVNGAKYGESL